MMTGSGRAVLMVVLASGVVSGCSSDGDATRYVIGGTVTGLTGSGLVLATAGQPDLEVAAGATSLAFATPVRSGTAYAVSVKQQPVNPDQTCGVANGTGTVAGGDVITVWVTCVDVGPFEVGGRINGLAGSGLVLAMQGQPDLPVAAGATTFAFSTPVASGTWYAVSVKQQPSGPDQTCAVASGTGVVGTADVTGVRVTCVNAGPYRIGGTVTWLAPAGPIDLGTPGQPDLRLWSGPFSFPNGVATGVPYSVTVTSQAPGGFCSVANGIGVVADADVTSVDVTCDGRLGAGSLNVPRAFFTATGLGWSGEGHVLVAGGRIAGAELAATATAERFDPRTRRWTMASPMTVPRASACAALLPSGKVLVAGGSGTVANTAEVYDPASDSWVPVATRMAVGHDQSACLVLPSGKVLVIGGLNQGGSESTAVAELYDPDTGAFTTTGPMATARYRHTATLLADGSVLVAGGCTGGSPCAETTPTAELYDPQRGTWSAAGSLPVGVFGHTATVLDSKVLLVGGCQSDERCGPWGAGAGSPEPGASLYDPSTGLFSAVGQMATGRVGHVAFLDWPEVRVLGGIGRGATTEVFDPSTGSWEAGPAMASDHGGYMGAVVSYQPFRLCACSYWMAIGGLGPWSGSYPLTREVDGGWSGCTC